MSKLAQARDEIGDVDDPWLDKNTHVFGAKFMKSSSGPSSYAPRVTLTDRLRRVFRPVIERITEVLVRLGVTPNSLTVLGTLLYLVVGLIAASGELTLAGIVMFAVGPLDAFDGALARRLNIKSKLGAYLDSTLDRYADAFVLFGILGYTLGRGMMLEQVLLFITLLGTLLVSYTRARAEALGVECKVGLLSRVERYFILSAMLIFRQITPGLIVLAILTHFTVLQRISHVLRSIRRDENLAGE